MQILTILWSAGGAVAITLGMVCGLVWLVERRDRASLMLCVLGIATAAAAYGELGMMHSTTAAEYGAQLRWYYLPVFVALAAMLFFVHYYVGVGRVWLLWTVLATRAFQVVVNFLVQPNFAFSSIESIRSVSVFGEQVSTIGVATASERQWFAVASSILLTVYLVDTAAQGWLKSRTDRAPRGVAVIFGIALLWFLNVAYVQLMVYGLFQGPVSNLPWFLGVMVVMAFELGRDFILSKRERVELAELRAQLAHVDRISVMGQLASTLAHELAQPLSATAVNVAAGQAQLKREKPDLEELNSILADIGKDDHRASQIIDRMRLLFKRRAIELQPLRVEDVVQDVISLVRSEATSKHVALVVLMQPGLPRVSGDRVHFSQVLLNLIMNSIQAMQSRPLDDRRVVVEARADDAKGEVEVAVGDSGPGIPDSIAGEIFKPYFSTKSGGMGVGLALSRTIIEAHGGRLWLDQSTGHDGAIFRFTLRRVLEPQPTTLPVANSDPIPMRA